MGPLCLSTLREKTEENMHLTALKDLDLKIYRETCQASPNLGILVAVTNLSRFMFESFYSEIQDFSRFYNMNACMFCCSCEFSCSHC